MRFSPGSSLAGHETVPKAVQAILIAASVVRRIGTGHRRDQAVILGLDRFFTVLAQIINTLPVQLRPRRYAICSDNRKFRLCTLDKIPSHLDQFVGHLLHKGGAK